MRLTIVKYFKGDTIIIVHHKVPVSLGRIRAGPLMKHRAYAGQSALQHATPKIIFVHVVGDFALNQIHKLIAIGEIINRQNIGQTPTV